MSEMLLLLPGLGECRLPPRLTPPRKSTYTMAYFLSAEYTSAASKTEYCAIAQIVTEAQSSRLDSIYSAL